MFMVAILLVVQVQAPARAPARECNGEWRERYLAKICGEMAGSIFGESVKMAGRRYIHLRSILMMLLLPSDFR
jgi:hypothetical protein